MDQKPVTDAGQKLQAAITANERLARRAKALASDIDQEFAALKEYKATARQKRPPQAAGVPDEAGRRKILLIEDHPIVRFGISELLNYESDLRVAGVAEDRDVALRKIDELKPELIILDLCLKERSGLELLKEIRGRHPRLRVLILSLQDESVYAPRALRAGASGYVMKEEATDTLLAAVRTVLRGETYLSPAMHARLSQPEWRAETIASEPLHSLTDRELEVLVMIGQGRTSRDMARMLCISLKTIETHRTNIKHKLDLQNATQLVQLAVELEHKSAPARPPGPVNGSRTGPNGAA